MSQQNLQKLIQDLQKEKKRVVREVRRKREDVEKGTRFKLQVEDKLIVEENTFRRMTECLSGARTRQRELEGEEGQWNVLLCGKRDAVEEVTLNVDKCHIHDRKLLDHVVSMTSKVSNELRHHAKSYGFRHCQEQEDTLGGALEEAEQKCAYNQEELDEEVSNLTELQIKHVQHKMAQFNVDTEDKANIKKISRDQKKLMSSWSVKTKLALRSVQVDAQFMEIYDDHNQ